MANILDKRDKSMVASGNKRDVLVDKMKVYKWAKATSPGVLMNLNKNMLNIDDKYQRNQTSSKAVLRIARDWDWSLFGVLKVAKRLDGSYWVFDGGHRTRASFYRQDITELPCLVFEWDDIADEARAFIGGAKMTQRIASTDAFRAASVAMEPDACRTAAILSELGLRVTNEAHRADQVRCIHTIQKAVSEDELKAKRTLATCLMMTAEKPVSGAVFRGLFTLVRHYNGRDILKEFDPVFQKLTQEEMEQGIRRLKAEIGRGGATIEAKAIIAVMNKGRSRHKLRW